MPVSAWSTTAASNGATLGIDIAENCDAANVNNAIREMMAQLKTKLDALDALVGSASFQPLDTDLTAIAALTSAANKMPYATGAGTWALTDLSTFMRTVLDDGDAATALATLGAIIPSITSNGNGLSINLSIAGTVYRIQSGTVTVAGAGTAAITFPVAFSGTPVCVCSGGHTSSANSANDRITAVSASGATITSDYGSSHTAQWVAIGS